MDSILVVRVVTSWSLEDVTHPAITETDLLFASVARLYINELKLRNEPAGVRVVPVVSSTPDKEEEEEMEEEKMKKKKLRRN